MSLVFRTLALLRSLTFAGIGLAPLLAGAANTVFYPAPGLPQDHHYFVPVLGAQTELGAAAMYQCLRRTHPFMAVGVFHFQNVSMAGVEVPYVIANASYATLPEAQLALTDLRASIDYNKVLACMKLGDTTIMASEVTSFTLVPTYASLVAQGLAKPLKQPPDFDVAKLVTRTPLAPFDGIGHGAYAQGAPTASAIIHYRPMKSVDESLIVLNDFQARFPDVHFAVLQQGRAYYLTMAAMTSEATLNSALLEARKRGLYEFGRVDKISPTVTSAAVQDILAVKTLIPQQTVVLPQFDAVTVNAMPLVVERENLLEAPVDRVKRCIQQSVSANQSLPGKPMSSVEQISNCAGVVLTPKMLTRCVLGSDCLGPRVPVAILQQPAEIARQCLSQRLLAEGALAPGGQCAANPGDTERQSCVAALRQSAATACLASTLDTAFVQLMAASGMKDCLANAGAAANCPTRAKFESTLCAQGFAKEVCSDKTKLTQVSGRVFDVVACVKGGSCTAVVPRLGYTPEQLTADIARMGQVAQDALSIVPGGIEFLNSEQAKIVADFKACQDTADATAKEACFVRLGLNDQEKVAYACVQSAAGNPDKLFQCSINGNKAVAAGVDKARCIRDASLDPGNVDASKLAVCLGWSDSAVKSAIASASAKADCVRGQLSPLDVVEKCIDGTPANVKATLACARSAGNGASAAQLVATCLPTGVGDKLATANCLVTAPTDAARLGCVPGFLGPIDPETQKAMACAATVAASPDVSTALVSCVPSAGKTVAQIADAAKCLGDASTEVEQAACLATGVGADPKVVAAVTCLAKSDGDNAAMVACAAGAALPPNVAKVASCAAESSGETDFAICASGLKMNPEWRIASECAAESGGVPVAFAGCTAGRLTVRELQKCLSGQIGGEGGCFGPSNEIVKAVNTIGNDLTHGLGDNNDLRVALGKVTEPLKQLVNGFVNGVQHAAEQVGNAVGGAAHWVGCRIGIGC